MDGWMVRLVTTWAGKAGIEGKNGEKDRGGKVDGWTSMQLGQDVVH